MLSVQKPIISVRRTALKGHFSLPMSRFDHTTAVLQKLGYQLVSSDWAPDLNWFNFRKNDKKVTVYYDESWDNLDEMIMINGDIDEVFICDELFCETQNVGQNYVNQYPDMHAKKGNLLSFQEPLVPVQKPTVEGEFKLPISRFDHTMEVLKKLDYQLVSSDCGERVADVDWYKFQKNDKSVTVYYYGDRFNLDDTILITGDVDEIFACDELFEGILENNPNSDIIADKRKVRNGQKK